MAAFFYFWGITYRSLQVNETDFVLLFWFYLLLHYYHVHLHHLQHFNWLPPTTIILITIPNNPNYQDQYSQLSPQVITITTLGNLENSCFTYIFIQIPLLNYVFDHIRLYNRAKGIIKILVVDIDVGRTNLSKFG